MNQELTRYIQFAIDEGDYYFAEFIYGESKRFKVERNKEVRYINQDGEAEYINVIELITSKPFIEAVARGKLKSDFYDSSKNMAWVEEEMDTLTTQQAIAIRDDKLEEFINNLLPKD